MAVDLTVISNTTNLDLSSFDLQKVINQSLTQMNFDAEIRNYLDELQLHKWKVKKSNVFGFNELSIDTGLDYCVQVRLYHDIVSFHPSGFRTRFSSWIKMHIREDNMSELELKYWENWSKYHRLVCVLSAILGGGIIIFIDDGSLQLEDKLLDDGSGFNSFFAAMKNQMESWPLEYLELYPEEFVNKSSFFYEEIDKKHLY